MPIDNKDVTWVTEPTIGFWEASFLPAIVEGLKTTISHVTNYKPVTEQYPEQKPELPLHYRGLHRLNKDDQGRPRTEVLKIQFDKLIDPKRRAEELDWSHSNLSQLYEIGYQAGLKLLRCGARLLVSTRFPRDAASRFAEEPDFSEWSDRLQIFGLDLRHTPSVEAFCQMLLATERRLDFIINNACQTVRRPPEFYAHMMDKERATLIGPGDPAGKLVVAAAPQYAPGMTHSAELSQVALLPEDLEGGAQLFPKGALDQDLQQVDLRGRNSWRLLMHEVSAVELLEVQLVNAVAPFIINARLKELMLRTPEQIGRAHV